MKVKLSYFGLNMSLLALTLFTLTSYGKPQIVTTITPIASLASMVLKDKADIEALAVGSGCPHHYNLKPSDLKKVQNADIAIYIDEEFDGFAEKLINNHAKTIIKISDIKNLKIIEMNLHLWLDLDNAKVILQELAKIFSEKFPDLKQDINNNLELALRELTALQETKNNELANLKDVILLNDSSEYFFVNPNIKTTKLYSGTQKSLKYFSKLEDLIKNSNNKCLILNLEQNPELYNKLDTKIVRLNSENWEIRNIVKSVGFNYKERGAKPIIIGETTSDNVSEFKSFDYIDSGSFRNLYLEMIDQVKKCR
ncbi:MAG TPA: zinc ABC transporter substrate-binding protein [Rickettsia endosymbiont of Pyrocoelia pectoralis]|nr:zinc ABC transporter substrate-binding protein [Rickettsia endosymbiont of Pyrocoelia pectoralis]